MNSREMIAVIEADGWYLVRSNGSHHHFKHPEKAGLVTIPHPRKDLLPATAASILRQARICYAS
ncbi:type II toxin-antitoxin system HicA family toxin [Pseudomonas soli]|uniref:type II toxin-antitoxin system HicA family toxin n=1 Tax=Pseudomonas soli TaxID=1306993 RepID=UPI003D00291D